MLLGGLLVAVINVAWRVAGCSYLHIAAHVIHLRYAARVNPVVQQCSAAFLSRSLSLDEAANRHCTIRSTTLRIPHMQQQAG